MTSLPPPTDQILNETAPAVEIEVGPSLKRRWAIGLTLLIGTALLIAVWVAREGPASIPRASKPTLN